MVTFSYMKHLLTWRHFLTLRDFLASQLAAYSCLRATLANVFTSSCLFQVILATLPVPEVLFLLAKTKLSTSDIGAYVCICMDACFICCTYVMPMSMSMSYLISMLMRMCIVYVSKMLEERETCIKYTYRGDWRSHRYRLGFTLTAGR